MEAKLLKLMCQLRLEGIVFDLNSFEYGSQKANEIVMQGIRPLEIFYNYCIVLKRMLGKHI